LGLKYIQKTSKKITSNFLEELLIDRGILRNEVEFKVNFFKPSKENLEDFRHLDNIEEGIAKYTEQDESKSTKCSMFTNDMGVVDFNKPAKEIVGLIKGLAVWPNVKITINGVYFKLYNAVVSNINGDQFKPGQVVKANNKEGLHIKCGEGVIEITELLPINSKKMTAKSYLNGKTIEIGSKVE
jgi:methionyl-tRNA formyltransferase